MLENVQEKYLNIINTPNYIHTEMLTIKNSNYFQKKFQIFRQSNEKEHMITPLKVYKTGKQNKN